MIRLLLAVVAAVTLAACGDDPAIERESRAASESADLEHIHGLGVHPDDDTLYIATHAGLFTAADGETQVQRVGNSRQDIMGFSVVGASRFIGSGHPDPADTSSPPSLGLIESDDGGQSWQNVSLLGEADFHVLQSAGERVYGFDGMNGRLMVSSDGGSRWTQQAPPAGVYDLAIEPEDADHIVASTEAGIFTSTNAGKGWRPLRDDTAGMLAWADDGRLYLVDGQGQVAHSADGGRKWQRTGTIGGQPVAFLAHGQALYVALADGTVKRSADGGAGWTVRAAP